MELIVTVEKIIFENIENGYTILLVNDGKKTFTAKGKTIGLSPDVSIRINGEFNECSKYGKEFLIEKWEEVLPTELNKMELFLGSGVIKGIGPTIANSIVKRFKESTYEMLDFHSEELLKVPKIGKKTLEKILNSWDEHRYMMTVIPDLLSIGITLNLAVKIFKEYKYKTLEVINENPYKLIYDIDGIGFLKADDIAKKIGYDLNSIERCRGGIYYIMAMDGEEGSTYMLKSDIVKKSINLLNIDSIIINMALLQMVEERIIINDEEKYFLKTYYNAEKEIADHLRTMSRIFTLPYNYDLAIENIEEEYGIKYEYEQKEAIKTALSSNVMVLTGGPGTGKTTVTRGIINALKHHKLKIKCAAPTGKAAERMSEATGHYAETIHRLLEYNPQSGYKRNGENPLNADVIIIDEASMINVLLMKHLISAIPYKSKLILIGDVDQLPCIGAGNVLKDIINSNRIPVIKLDKIFRQAQSSKIIRTSHSINKQIPIDLKNDKDDDLFFINQKDHSDALDLIVSLVTHRLPKKYNIDPKEIQVLTPMKIGSLGTELLNQRLQDVINPKGEELKYGANVIFRKGDKVMQIKNNYDKGVFNGDTGYITSIDVEEKILIVEFKNETVVYEKNDLDELILAYASTIHKSQGSEYDIVIIPIFKTHMKMLQRNLIYTAITRAKKLCIIVGEYGMFQYAIKNIEVDNRLTALKEFIL